MKDIELDSRGRAGSRVAVWLLPGAIACIGVGVLLPLRASERRERAPVQPQASRTDQSVEIDRLKQAISLLEQKSAVLAAAVSSPDRNENQRSRGEEPGKAPGAVEETRTEAEMHQEEITALEVRLESEKDGSRESLLAERTMQAELGAAALGEARIKEVACSSSLCRATLEQDVSAKPLDINALIESSPTVRRESMFNYETEGSLKRVTIYSAREGHHLNPSEPNGVPNAPTH